MTSPVTDPFADYDPGAYFCELPPDAAATAGTIARRAGARSAPSASMRCAPAPRRPRPS